MAQHTPYVKNGKLVYPADQLCQAIDVESAEWWKLLQKDTFRIFRYESDQGSFTARREKKCDKNYWYAYQVQRGKLVKAYLGKTDTLTNKRLLDIAASHFSGTKDTLETQPGASAILPDIGTRKREKGRKRSDVDGSLLLLTKLLPPLARQDIVARPELLKTIKDGLHKKLLLITAAAGFGKTTLLGDWYHSAERSQFFVAWISLEKSENDLTTFWRYVTTAISRTCGRHLALLPMMLYSPGNPPIEYIIYNLINNISTLTKEVVLVIENYHTILAQPIHDTLAFLLTHMPPQLHLIITGRSEPPLPLTLLRSQDQLAEIRADELRFTSEEVYSLFDMALHLRLSEDSTHLLRGCTDGWAMGLRLALLAMQEHHDITKIIDGTGYVNSYIDEYMMEEVISQLPDYLQVFLMQTSITNSINSSLCQMLTGRNDCQHIIEEIEALGLFITRLDHKKQWYRYHQTFCNALRGCLERRQPQMVVELHQRASQWYKSRNMMADAIEHLLEVQDFHGAINLLEEYAEKVWMSNQRTPLLHWLERLPENVIYEHFKLSLYYAWVLFLTAQFTLSQQCLERIERVYGASHERANTEQTTEAVTGQGEQSDITGYLSVIKAAITVMQPDIARAIALCHLALSALPAGEVYWHCIARTVLGLAYACNGHMLDARENLVAAATLSLEKNNLYITMLSYWNLSHIDLSLGNLESMDDIYRYMLNIAEKNEQWRPLLQGYAQIGQGSLAYERDTLEVVPHLLTHGIELCKQGGLSTGVLEGYITLSRLRNARGDFNGALNTLEEADLYLRQNLVYLSPWAYTPLAVQRVKLYLLQGRLDETIQYLQSQRLTFVYKFEDTIHLRLALHQKKYNEVLHHARKLFKEAEEVGCLHNMIEILLLQARACYGQKRREQALRYLAQALSLAEATGYVRSICDEGPDILPLVALLIEATCKKTLHVEDSPSMTFLSMLLDIVKNAQRTDKKASASAKPLHGTLSSDHLLTERETEIVQCIVEGMATSEIAHCLIIAESTVKWYLKQIYRKLYFHNRAQVVTWALRQGFSPRSVSGYTEPGVEF